MMDVDGKAGEIIADYGGKRHQASIPKLDYGYKAALPIQSIPGIIKELSQHSITVYQVVHYEKAKSTAPH
jgi:hypothetical protein